MDYSELLQYCETDTQQRTIQAIIDAGSQRKAAQAMGLDKRTIERTVQRVKCKASLRGYSPEHDMTRTAPDGFLVRGVSTLYNKDGEQSAQWVKTSIDTARQYEIIKEAVRALAEDLPKLPKVKSVKRSSSDLMAVYPLGDPHIGVRSWAEETGQDWDLKIAEEKFCAVFDRLVKTAPSCDQALIVNLGDYFHSDNMEGVTSRSKHPLDMDGRFAKMIQVGVKIMLQMIHSALEHHKKVRVINAVGNHDDTGALWLSVCLSHMFAKNPRVEIDQSPAPFHYVEFGNNLLGIHHGHTCKAASLPGVMASDQSAAWGRTLYRLWLTGHIHHDTLKEYAGVRVESFRTLAAKDAYATWGGYRSGQDSKCLVIHKEHGEIERHTVNLAMA